jgi:hypothetical protein
MAGEQRSTELTDIIEKQGSGHRATELVDLVEMGFLGQYATEVTVIVEEGPLGIYATELVVIVEYTPLDAPAYYAVHAGFDSSTSDLVRIDPQPSSKGIKVTRRSHSHNGDLIDEFLYCNLDFNITSIADYQDLLIQLGLDSSDDNEITLSHRDKALRWKKWNGKINIPTFGDDFSYHDFFPREISFLVTEMELSAS